MRVPEFEFEFEFEFVLVGVGVLVLVGVVGERARTREPGTQAPHGHELEPAHAHAPPASTPSQGI